MSFLANLFKSAEEIEEELLMELGFPEKFPKLLKKFSGQVHKDTIKIIANLKIKKDETYEREIVINDKPKRYKIILKAGKVN